MSGAGVTPKAPANDEALDSKKELHAMAESLKLLEKLSSEGRQRVFSYLASALGIAGIGSHTAGTRTGSSGSATSNRSQIQDVGNEKYQSFADLYAAARPEKGAEKALIGGYWFQVCLGGQNFVAADVNAELKNVGDALSNVTVAFETLKSSKPALVMQMGKSGKAQQARKTYKLTVVGIRAAQEMLARQEG